MDLDFSWPVAESYQIRRMEKPSRRLTIAEGCFDPANAVEPFEIVPSGTVRRDRPPLDKLPMATALLGRYRHFGKVAKSKSKALQETALEFAKQYGLLLGRSEDGQPEALDTWHYLISDILALQKAFEFGRWELSAEKIAVERIEAALVPDPLTRAPRLVLRPTSLRGAIQLQLAHRLSRGASLRMCRHCGGPFEAGIDGKRGDAKFCSDACRYSFNNKRRAK